jgi:hypothetical protein
MTCCFENLRRTYRIDGRTAHNILTSYLGLNKLGIRTVAANWHNGTEDCGNWDCLYLAYVLLITTQRLRKKTSPLHHVCNTGCSRQSPVFPASRPNRPLPVLPPGSGGGLGILGGNGKFVKVGS